MTHTVRTPPDPITIWLMGIQMTLLYFVSVGVADVVTTAQVDAMRKLDAELAAQPTTDDDDDE